jgi:hypothetical protein
MKKPESLEEAKAMMAEIRQEWGNLYADAERDGDDCFWCCGGGDDRADELRSREMEVRALFPDADFG